MPLYIRKEFMFRRVLNSQIEGENPDTFKIIDVTPHKNTNEIDLPGVCVMIKIISGVRAFDTRVVETSKKEIVLRISEDGKPLTDDATFSVTSSILTNTNTVTVRLTNKGKKASYNLSFILWDNEAHNISSIKFICI